MTVRDLFGLCGRRWIVLIFGIALALSVAGWVRSFPGVYTAQTDMTFLAPASARFPNPLGITSGSLVSVAGTVERAVNQGRTVPASVSMSVTLVDLGIRSGTEIRLPDTGGQWAHNFARPVLDVQAVGPTEQQVRGAMAAQIAAIRTELDRLQDAAQVDGVNRITVEPSPSTVDVVYRTGHQTVGAGMALLLGLMLSLFVAAAVDRRAVRHRGGVGAPGRGVSLLARRPGA